MFKQLDVEIQIEDIDIAEVSSGWFGLEGSQPWMLGLGALIALALFWTLFRIAKKIAFILLAVALVAVLTTQSSNLKTCLQTCKCDIFNQSLSFPSTFNYCDEETGSSNDETGTQ